jgi:hypothetical protein
MDRAAAVAAGASEPVAERREMKVVRAPWIRCRAGEAGARSYEMEWQRITFSLLAYSEKEARSWWNGLDEHERNGLLGLGDAETSDQIGLF